MIRKISAYLKQSTFFKSVLKVGSGQLIGQALSLITLPILSRIYPEAAFGEQTLLISTATIIINYATLGLNSAIMKPKDDDEAKRVFTAAFSINVLISTVLVAACLALSGVFKLFALSGSYALSLLLAWLYITLTNTSGLLNTYVNRKGEYTRLFFNPIIGGLGNALIAIPLGLLGMGYIGLIAAGVVSSFFTCVHMARGDIPLDRSFRPKHTIHVIKEYREYVLFQYPANCIANTAYEYPTQFLGRTFTAQELGGYSMCLRVLKYPIRLIAAPISTVYFKTATQYHQEGRNLAAFTYKMISRILLISLAPVIVACIFSEPVFVFALGENWREAGTIAAILSVQYVFMFCSQCTSYCRVAIEKQKANLIFSIFRLVITIVSAALGYTITGTMLGTLIFVSVSQSVCWMADMALNFWFMDRKSMGKYILISVLYMAAVYFAVAQKLV